MTNREIEDRLRELLSVDRSSGRMAVEIGVRLREVLVSLYELVTEMERERVREIASLQAEPQAGSRRA